MQKVTKHGKVLPNGFHDATSEDRQPTDPHGRPTSGENAGTRSAHPASPRRGQLVAGNPTHNPPVIKGNQDVPGAHSAALTSEQWRWVPGYEGLYEVSDQGRVYSHHSKHILKPARERYLYVNLVKDRRNKRFTVHKLVMLAFVGPRPEGLQVRHLDGKSYNCIRSNLAYGTVSENNYDRVRHGTHQEARKTHCIHGHEFTPENTAITRNGSRRCRACALENHHRWVTAHPERQHAIDVRARLNRRKRT